MSVVPTWFYAPRMRHFDHLQLVCRFSSPKGVNMLHRRRQSEQSQFHGPRQGITCSRLLLDLINVPSTLNHITNLEGSGATFSKLSTQRISAFEDQVGIKTKKLGNLP
ncbi:hypothetical protein F4677DRAFT_381856 [Hypoxylon crocopeplum]|nr:hypothetical protein F4677DRAFT_381856 [Hypoxylon crocopeplum]